MLTRWTPRPVAIASPHLTRGQTCTPRSVATSRSGQGGVHLPENGLDNSLLRYACMMGTRRSYKNPTKAGALPAAAAQDDGSRRGTRAVTRKRTRQLVMWRADHEIKLVPFSFLFSEGLAGGSPHPVFRRWVFGALTKPSREFISKKKKHQQGCMTADGVTA